MSNALPGILKVNETGKGLWTGPHPETDPEGRDVVFSGQILAQMIMISSAASGGKEVKSIHAIFARAGAYSAGPIQYRLESLHAGRAWASDTVTAMQGERLLCRSLVLLNTVEPDLMRHSPAMPDVPPPEKCNAKPARLEFPAAEVRAIDRPARTGPNGTPVVCEWVRNPAVRASIAANQAMISWSQPGYIIGTAMLAHPGEVDIAAAHRSISTGVISHSAHFHEAAPDGEWLLFVHEAPYAGRGRVFGSGAVFTQKGLLVSTFGQDSMARRIEGTLDPKRAM